MNSDEYVLDINFNNEQLKLIHQAHAFVVIGRTFLHNDFNVAWQVFRPMQKNRITWKESYGIYASTCSAHHGAAIIQRSNSGLEAYPGKTYELHPDGTISAKRDVSDGNSFILKNNYTEKKIMTIGLFQNASLNGETVTGNAISASPVMLGHTANMTPTPTINVWIQSHIKSNTVISQITSPIISLIYTAQRNALAISYDDQKGEFFTT